MEETLMKLKAKIKEHKNEYLRNETAVRTQLIEPLLNKLGWYTDDPVFVKLNSTTEERDIPDYALIINKKVETFIEAKNLSINIIDHIPQLARYCIHNGKEFGIITNGNEWLLIKTFEKDTKLKDRIIWQISIENDSPEFIINRLEQISRKQIENLSELIENEKRIEKFWSQFIADNSQLVERLANEITKDFLNSHPTFNYNQGTVLNNFKSRLSSLLTHKAFLSNIELSHSNYSKENNSNNITNQKSDSVLNKKSQSKSPSTNDWVEKIPELKNIQGLNTWQSICNHLNIPVEGDSARRRLSRWVAQNRRNWEPVP